MPSFLNVANSDGAMSRRRPRSKRSSAGVTTTPNRLPSTALKAAAAVLPAGRYAFRNNTVCVVKITVHKENREPSAQKNGTGPKGSIVVVFHQQVRRCVKRRNGAVQVGDTIRGSWAISVAINRRRFGLGGAMLLRADEWNIV